MRFKPIALALFAVLTLASGGCASAYHIATIGAGTAHLSLVTTSKFADTVVCGTPTAPPAPACRTNEQRQAIAKVLDPAFGWDATLLEQLAQYTDGPIPQAIADLRAQITKALNDALAALKDVPGLDKLAAQIGAKK
jgi:hypothetical protein